MSDLPAAMQQIVDDFADIEAAQRLMLLLEFSNELPPVPAKYADHPELLEPVPECQSPIFLAVELEPPGSTDTDDLLEPVVRLYFSAPPEAPTTRGFAGILHEGLDGLPASVVLNIPSDLPSRLSLTEQVSPLRLRGMSGMLERIRAQVKRALD